MPMLVMATLTHELNLVQNWEGQIFHLKNGKGLACFCCFHENRTFSGFHQIHICSLGMSDQA